MNGERDQPGMRFKCFLIIRGKILDVACGTGLNMLDLKSNPDALLYGCDISQYLLDIATENGVEVENLFCVDATKLDFEKNFLITHIR